MQDTNDLVSEVRDWRERARARQQSALRALLVIFDGNVARLARALGWDRSNLRRTFHLFDIDVRDFRKGNPR